MKTDRELICTYYFSLWVIIRIMFHFLIAMIHQCMRVCVCAICVCAHVFCACACVTVCV